MVYKCGRRTDRQRLPDRDSRAIPNKFLLPTGELQKKKKNLKLHNYKLKALLPIAARINFFSPVTGFRFAKMHRMTQPGM